MLGDDMKKILLCIVVIFILIQFSSAFAAEDIDNDTANVNEIVIKLLWPEIQSAVDSFYFPYLTVSPQVAYYYGTEIVEVSDNQLTIETTPYIGPHIGVGEDKITFNISNSGDVTVSEYEHIKSYELPPHRQSIIKKPLP